MKNLNVKFLIVLIVLLTAATGCGDNAEIENYKANMNQFFENVRIFDSSINAIDPSDENAPAALLSLLDSMNTSFEQMAALEVPGGFPGVDELADEASRYMSEAVSCYHQAYEGESFDATAAEMAYYNYECANVRLQYIISILHGNIPEEIFTYDEEETEDGEDASNEMPSPVIRTTRRPATERIPVRKGNCRRNNTAYFIRFYTNKVCRPTSHSIPLPLWYYSQNSPHI